MMAVPQTPLGDDDGEYSLISNCAPLLAKLESSLKMLLAKGKHPLGTPQTRDVPSLAPLPDRPPVGIAPPSIPAYAGLAAMGLFWPNQPGNRLGWLFSTASRFMR
jgi:hypothetical protein